MRHSRLKSRYHRAIPLLCGLGAMLQFGGCDIGTISTTTTTTVDGRDALISLIRGAILTPLDAFITDSVNNAFGNDEG